MNKATERPNKANNKIKMIVECFALGQGCTLHEVYPTREEAQAAWADRIDDTVEQNIFGGGGYIAPVTLERSLIHTGMWCVTGAEEGNDGMLCQAFDYFQTKAWMKPKVLKF